MSNSSDKRQSAVSRSDVYVVIGLVVLTVVGLTLTVFALGGKASNETEYHPNRVARPTELIGSRSSTEPAPSGRPRTSRAARTAKPNPKPSPESAGFTSPVVLPGGPRLSASQANEYVEFVRNSAERNSDLFDDLDAYTDLDLVQVGADACLWRRKGGDYREFLELAGYGPFEANIYASAAEAFLC